MPIIRPEDLVLIYFQKRSGTQDKVIDDLDQTIRKLGDVLSPIDFNWYAGKRYSEVIGNVLWNFRCSDLIEKNGEYSLTEYGRRISPYLLKEVREQQPEVFRRLNEVL